MIMAAAHPAAVPAAEVTASDLSQIAARPHPRLLLGPDGDRMLRANAATPFGKLIAAMVTADAEHYLKIPVTPRRVDHGGRTLKFARTVFLRLSTLATAYRLTGDERFAERGKAELLAAARLEAWYERYFLDCAEMTLGVSLAYDWLHDRLTPEERRLVADAIIEKGLKASYRGRQNWVAGKNNWCQVCHTAMSAGALAVADVAPELAQNVLNRALENLPNIMRISYYPRGAYPEGPMYWAYGTSFNCIMIALLDNAFGHDFGLSGQPGFAETGDFITAVTGNTGRRFSYCDSNNMAGFSFTNVWLIKKFNRPDWLPGPGAEKLRRNVARGRRGFDRLFPLTLLYADALQENPDTSRAPGIYFSGNEAKTHLVVLRPGHDRKSPYLGIKGGSPRASHGHMDGGSFIYENRGVRWLDDLGPSAYGTLEKNGIKTLFGFKQGSDRWQVFRIGPESHNILRLGAGEQQVAGSGTITEIQPGKVVMDLSSLYTPYARQVIRTWRLDSGKLVVTDLIRGAKPGEKAVFQFCSEARLDGIDGPALKLSSEGETLSVTSEPPGRWEYLECDRLHRSWDPSDPGKFIARFTTAIPESGELVLNMVFK